MPATAPGAATRVAVIGAGWAGLAAAVETQDRGHHVFLFEMASQAGGRARQVPGNEQFGGVDNGQHILIGAYTETLALMSRLAIEPAQALLRLPLSLTYPDGSGLQLPAGPAVPAFIRGVMGQHRWPLHDRLALLGAAAGWRWRGFSCPSSMSVAELTRPLPLQLRQSLIDPLCIAALNTPSEQASAAVFLRVLRDALFAGPGAADLLLPRRRLSALLPTPALAKLREAGADVRLGRRVREMIRNDAGGWRVDGEVFDAVIIAATAAEAARLTAAINPDWSATAAALRFEPIVTLTVQSAGARLPLPMMALHCDQTTRPVQFVFDQGQLGASEGLLTLVISGAAAWLERGREALVVAALAQLRDQLGKHLAAAPELLQIVTDKRATFSSTPGLKKPPMVVADALLAAGDYIAGPYPATLEAAVRSGLAAARAIHTSAGFSAPGESGQTVASS